LLARLIATSLGHAVFSISPAWLFQSGVGESEKRLRDLFMEARRCAPALVLIDDIGALFPPDDDMDGASSIMAQLFILLDQLRLASPPVRIVATAAHPSHVNPALTRAGRLDHHVYIAPPSREERLSILAYIHAVLNHDDKQAVVKQCQDVDLLLLARVSGGLTVSELLSLYSVLKKQDGVLDTRAWVLAILFVKKQAMME
jgi:SpoVK/Ycf46/Vps4 family AAA+-type ATPase